MKREDSASEVIWRSFVELAESRSKFFTKHGERFDRRLFAEIEGLIRLTAKFRQTSLIDSDPDSFRKLHEIQREMLEKGQDIYLDFP